MLRPRMRWVLVSAGLVSLSLGLPLAGCGGGESPDDGRAKGGSTTGGMPATGGGASGGTTPNGGAPSGGVPSGGTSNGGSSGSAGGGAPSGGASGSGGSSEGGASGGGGAGGATGGDGSGGTAGEGGSSGEADGGTAGGGTAGQGGGGDAGASGSGTMMLSGPIERGGKAVLEFGELFFEVTPAVGGRITAARLGTNDALAPTNVHPNNYGSTFWTAPQSDWSWPPVEAIDSAAYTLMVEDTSFTVTSPAVTGTDTVVDGVRVTKKFSPDFAANAIVVEYTIVNGGGSAKKLAPWEITRVAPGGLTFFASDTAPFPAMGGAPELPTTSMAGCYWFQNSPSTPQGKLFSDGKGWLAHVTPDDLLFVKVFPDVATGEFAPGEAEIEIYSTSSTPSEGSRYVEVENQGAYATIPAQGSSTWKVIWYLRRLPDGVTRAPSQALVDFVLETIQ